MLKKNAKLFIISGSLYSSLWFGFLDMRTVNHRTDSARSSLGYLLVQFLSSAAEVFWFAEVLALTLSSSDLSVAAIFIFLNISREAEKHPHGNLKAIAISNRKIIQIAMKW